MQERRPQVESQGEFNCSFFGRWVDLARRVAMILKPGKTARFRVIIWDDIAPPKTGDRTADILKGVENVNAFVEARVREHPEEWFWTHRRWPREVYAAMKTGEKTERPG